MDGQVEDRAESGKVHRIKLWTAGLALAAAAAGVAWKDWRFGAGVAAGGGIVLGNLLGTEASARRLVGNGPRWSAILLHFGKLGAIGALIAALLLTRLVSPYALLLGLAAFPVAAVLDILFFPAHGKGGKEGFR